MEKYLYTTSMGIQQTAFVRQVRIRYSFPKERPSAGGKDDGAGGLCEVGITATRAITTQSEPNTHVNRANSLRIRVHCNMTGSRPLRLLVQAESPAPEAELAREQDILSVPSDNSKHRALYQRLVGSANPTKEYYHAKSLPA
jgi:hypothetical protein